MTPDARLREELAGLARAHLASPTGAPPTPLGPRLRRLERGLAATFRRLAGRRYAPGELPAAVEWLRDNDHVIQDALAQVRLSLPRGYYARLPAPGRGPDAGRPRAESLARELVDRLEAPLDIDAVAVLLDDYQAVAPLAIGELWALPALLRLAVLERLAPAAAAAVAQSGASVTPSGPGAGGGAAAPRSGAAPPTWADEPAAPAAPIAAAVRTLRTLAAADWRAWFERCSVLERTLREDPSGDYARMSFATRDRYRRTVESLARGSGTHDELGVARAALALAAAAAPAAHAAAATAATGGADEPGARAAAPTAGSARRLPPDRRGPRRPRDRDRLHTVAPAALGARARTARLPALRGLHRPRRRRGPGHRADTAGRARGARRDRGRRRAAGGRPGVVAGRLGGRLAGHARRAAARAAADGPRRRRPARSAHAGGHAGDPARRPRRGAAAGAARGELPRQPRRQPRLRAAHRPGGRRRAPPARRRRDRRGPEPGHPRPQRPLRGEGSVADGADRADDADRGAADRRARAQPRATRRSTCSTANAAGTRSSACGWGGSASAASSRSSTNC
jgi:hypothetical protein